MTWDVPDGYLAVARSRRSTTVHLVREGARPGPSGFGGLVSLCGFNMMSPEHVENPGLYTCGSCRKVLIKDNRRRAQALREGPSSPAEGSSSTTTPS